MHLISFKINIFLLIFFNFIFSNPYELDSNLNHFNYILNNFVDNNGKVNYFEIRNNPYHFNKYFDFIKNISPNNHPELFPSKNDKKAYWINVYNALILKLMIDNPNKNILDISIFKHTIFFKKFIIGGEKISPFKIENKILRKIYKDPRRHFAINCVSNSCPPLGNRILIGDSLDYELDKKTNEYINNPLNVNINHTSKTIYLNKIFKWFKKDFEKDFSSINGYIYNYLFDKNRQVEKAIFLSYKIRYDQYDWLMNAQ